MQNIENSAETVIKKGPFISKVIDNKELAPNIRKLTIENEEIVKNSLPGQFVSVICANLTLRRPFSVAGVKDNTFELIYKVIGTGTEFLAELKTGDTVNFIGPMGNSYKIENKKHLLIGCGVGIAPIDFMADTLKKQGFDYKTIACFRTKYNTERQYDYLITEDGSSEITGRLNDHLETIIKESQPEKICICGPNPAMRYVCEIAKKYSIDIEVTLEGEMACGTGVCMGCSIKIIKDGKAENARVCKDGPVFRGEEILWL